MVKKIKTYNVSYKRNPPRFKTYKKRPKFIKEKIQVDGYNKKMAERRGKMFVLRVGGKNVRAVTSKVAKRKQPKYLRITMGK